MQLEVETQSESKQDALLTQSELQLTSLNMTEEDRRLLHAQLRAELGAMLARAEWEGAKRTMRGVSVALFLCLVAIMSCFMWRWRQASQHGRQGLRSREDAEEALRGHYEAPMAVDQFRRPLSNPGSTGGKERSSPPSSTQPINGIKTSLPSYEEAQIPK